MFQIVDIIKYVLIGIITYIYLYQSSINMQLYDIRNFKIVILFIALLVFFDILTRYNKPAIKEPMANIKDDMDDKQTNDDDSIDEAELAELEEGENLNLDEKSLAKLMQSNE